MNTNTNPTTPKSLYAKLGIRIEKREHESFRLARKLSHETKARKDLAKFREEVEKGNRTPRAREKRQKLPSDHEMEFNWHI